MDQRVAVIGAGPAGLMAAEALSRAGVQVDLFDAMPSAGRKFLVAGKGGLNLTHSEPFEQFLEHYGERQKELEPFLRKFGPEGVRAWAEGLGVQTFIGTSNRIFPVGMKTAPLLRAWLARLKETGVGFHFRHRWMDWNEEGSLIFETPTGIQEVIAKAVVLALGGASWPVTGSDGAWVPLLRAHGIPVTTLKPANCGFDIRWSAHMREHFAGAPVKAVTASLVDSKGRSFHQQGEFVITGTGVEGSLIYACSGLLRDEIEASGSAILHLDLTIGYTKERLIERLARPRGSRSIASHLERSVGIRGAKAALLWEFVPRADFTDPTRLAGWIKDLPIPLVSPRPIEEAISSAGGVKFEALDERLMLKDMPGVFVAGEMLDWEAPTGGYLLTACMSTGAAAAQGILDWLKQPIDQKSVKRA